MSPILIIILISTLKIVLLNGSAQFQTSKSQIENPIKIIDIFTDYPSTDHVIKDYHKIREARLRQDYNTTHNKQRADRGRSISRRYTDYYDDNYYDHKSNDDAFYGKHNAHADVRPYNYDKDLQASASNAYASDKYPFNDNYASDKLSSSINIHFGDKYGDDRYESDRKYALDKQKYSNNHHSSGQYGLDADSGEKYANDHHSTGLYGADDSSENYASHSNNNYANSHQSSNKYPNPMHNSDKYANQHQSSDKYANPHHSSNNYANQHQSSDKYPNSLQLNDNHAITHQSNDNYASSHQSSDKYPNQMHNSDKYANQHQSSDKYANPLQSGDKYANSHQSSDKFANSHHSGDKYANSHQSVDKYANSHQSGDKYANAHQSGDKYANSHQSSDNFAFSLHSGNKYPTDMHNSDKYNQPNDKPHDSSDKYANPHYSNDNYASSHQSNANSHKHGVKIVLNKPQVTDKYGLDRLTSNRRAVIKYDVKKYPHSNTYSNGDAYDGDKYVGDKINLNKYIGDKNAQSKPSDLLESEFGIIDKVGNIVDDKFVYLQGQKYPSDKNKYKIYTINQQQSTEDTANNFNDKLNKFVLELNKNKRPSFETGRKNETRPVLVHDKFADQFSFHGQNNIVQSLDTLNKYFNKFGDKNPEEETQSEASEEEEGVAYQRPIRKRKKPMIANLEKPKNATKHKVTNMIRNHLIKMHKKQGENNGVKRISKSKDRTLNLIHTVDSVNTGYANDVTLLEQHKKYLTHPLEAIKNKTIKFANKFLSLFTVIQFDNFKCQATSSVSDYEGTCYLASECANLDGIAMGNCADGHGVCCVFRDTCGGVGSQNCSYFESPGYPNYYPEDSGVLLPGQETTIAPTNPLTPDPRLQFYMRQGRATSDELADALSCIYKVYKLSDDIKQMRIDFIDLELKGPTNGACVNERLIISGSNLNTMVPVICGYNTGQHVYVDVADLSGPLQIAILSTAVERKRFKLKICQYTDGCSGLMNCLQYYTGITGVITSFNYEQASTFSRSSPQYLNNLNYAICIKREPGYCTITYTNRASTGLTYPFELKNYDEDGMLTVPAGQSGVGVINCPDDYLVINGIRLCGDRLNDGSVNEDFSLNAPVTDYSGGPIIIPVRTSSTSSGRGFKLFYTQNLCGTTPGGGTGGTGGTPDPRLRRNKNRNF